MVIFRQYRTKTTTWTVKMAFDISNLQVYGCVYVQGVFWLDHPDTKESFGQITPQNFKGHFPKLKNTKESFVHITVEVWSLTQSHTAPHLTMSLSFFFSLVSEATYETRLRAREGYHVSSKSHSKVWDCDKGDESLERNINTSIQILIKMASKNSCFGTSYSVPSAEV